MEHSIGYYIDGIDINQGGVFISSRSTKNDCEYTKSNTLTKIYKTKGKFALDVELLKLYYFNSLFIGDDFWSNSIRYVTQSQLGRAIFRKYKDKKQEVLDSKKYTDRAKLARKLKSLDVEMCKEIAKYINSK